jgi:ribonuclease J
MRRRLAFNGLVTVGLGEGGRVEIASIGIPLDEDYELFVTEAKADVAAAIAKLKAADRSDPAAVTEAARLAARRAVQRWSGKKPQVQVLLLAAEFAR